MNRFRYRSTVTKPRRYRALAKKELNMKINLDKTLEQIEKEYWPEPNHASYLVRTCHLLRKKPVADFEIEDLRILISQNISLNVLLPIALDKLKENVFAEGDFYEGDLLISILTSDPKYWVDNKSNWKAVCETFETNVERLKQFDTTWEIRKNWFDNYELFRRIH